MLFAGPGLRETSLTPALVRPLVISATFPVVGMSVATQILQRDALTTRGKVERWPATGKGLYRGGNIGLDPAALERRIVGLLRALTVNGIILVISIGGSLRGREVGASWCVDMNGSVAEQGFRT